MSDTPESVPSVPLEPATPTGDEVPAIPLTPARPAEPEGPPPLFDLKEWREDYPRFDGLSDRVVMRLEGVAETLCPESYLPYDPANGVTVRKSAVYLALCHLCTLEQMPEGQSGQITSAGEGSVNTSFDVLKGQSYTVGWWALTKCGKAWWALYGGFRRGGRLYCTGNYHPWG